MKKGQIEIVGLMLILVIAGLVLAFTLTTTFNSEEQTSSSETFGEANMGKSFVQVITNTHIPACGQQYSALVKDCIRNGNLEEASDGDIICNGHQSCYYVNQTAHQILRKTLDKWGVSYYYHINQDGEELWNITNQGCDREKEKESPGRQVLPLYPMQSEATVTMEICKT